MTVIVYDMKTGLFTSKMGLPSSIGSTSVVHTGSHFRYEMFGAIDFRGNGFTYDSDGDPVTGTVTSVAYARSTFEMVGQFPVHVTYSYTISGISYQVTESQFGPLDPITPPAQLPPDFAVRFLQGNDSITGSRVHDEISALAGNDLVIGRGGGDLLRGNAGYDTLKGGAGNDRLVGGADADLLIGGAGTNTMIGGTGNDCFVFASADNGTQIITDFDDFGNDKINLTLMGPGSLTWIGAKSFANSPHANGSVRVSDIAGPDVLLQISVDGNSSVELQIRLVNTDASTITRADFVL